MRETERATCRSAAATKCSSTAGADKAPADFAFRVCKICATLAKQRIGGTNLPTCSEFKIIGKLNRILIDSESRLSNGGVGGERYR